MIGADAIIKCLEAEGVSTVFGYPGVAICPFFNSILDSEIRTVLIKIVDPAAGYPCASPEVVPLWYSMPGNIAYCHDTPRFP